MAHPSSGIAVYLEVGKKRTFAGAVDWPGWCRVGRDEGAALQALADSGPRYARALHAAGIAFEAPADTSALAVVERLDGSMTTDFGAPDIAPSSEDGPHAEAELRREQGLLRACWQGFDAAVRGAAIPHQSCTRSG